MLGVTFSPSIVSSFVIKDMVRHTLHTQLTKTGTTLMPFYLYAQHDEPDPDEEDEESHPEASSFFS